MTVATETCLLYTLLRGPEGALFPAPGVYRVVLEATWHLAGIAVRTAGEATLMVTPAVDQDHASAALRILDNPDSLIALAIGGDHMKRGLAAIDAGLQCPVLQPHYAFIEAKRLGRRFEGRKADIEAASTLVKRDTVMSSSEIRRAVRLVDADSLLFTDPEGCEFQYGRER